VNDLASASSLLDDASSSPKLDIIWNTTMVCGWNCAACCVAATHVKQKNGLVFISTPELDRYEEIPADPGAGNIFDQALQHRQARGLELTFEQKLQVLDNLAGHRVQVDLSGGDVLSPRKEGTRLLDAAVSKLGRHALTLTATGSGLAHADVKDVAKKIKELNFTFDGTPDPDNPLRPATYAATNLRKAKQFAAEGVITRAECPLSAQNLEPAALERIYLQLRDAGIDKFLLMRLFPSGRGEFVREAIPTNLQYKRAIATLRSIEAEYGGPEVKLQCALRWLEGPSVVNPCDAITESFGLMWDGTLLGSPWAISKSGRPVDQAWVLGNLAENTLTEILASEKVERLRSRAAENHGSCKMFAWFHGSSKNSEDRMFEDSDPLYNSTQALKDAA
jgi:MoaA/NifB/PqqE/SkfB family radical SAM enzyme